MMQYISFDDIISDIKSHKNILIIGRSIGRKILSFDETKVFPISINTSGLKYPKVKLSFCVQAHLQAIENKISNQMERLIVSRKNSAVRLGLVLGSSVSQILSFCIFNAQPGSKIFLNGFSMNTDKGNYNWKKQIEGIEKCIELAYERDIEILFIDENKRSGHFRFASYKEIEDLQRESDMNISKAIKTFKDTLFISESLATKYFQETANIVEKELGIKTGTELNNITSVNMLKKYTRTFAEETVSGDVAMVDKPIGKPIKRRLPDGLGPNKEPYFEAEEEDFSPGKLFDGRKKFQRWKKYVEDEGIATWAKENPKQGFYIKLKSGAMVKAR